MLIPSISNETNQLLCVLLGLADQSGSIPTYDEAYDPKSRLHIAKGTYPNEIDLVHQLDLMLKWVLNYLEWHLKLLA